MKDFREELVRRCPTIFREGSLRCGVDCPPGWEELVMELSLKLEDHARQKNPELMVDQIKSKFGGLRYYLSCHDEAAEILIDIYEAHSLRTCETCGEPGERMGRGWVVTACPEHAPRT